jgi:drug/metabolite transporter (DMT)-like permease
VLTQLEVLMSGQPRAIAVGVFVTVLWSSSWLLVRWGDTHSIDPVSFAALRYLGAAAVLIAVTAVRHRRAAATLLRDRTTLRWVAGLGVVYYAITQAAQFVAIVHQPAATTSLVLSATVVVVALLSRLTLREPITGTTVLGAVVVVAGSLIFLRGALGFSVVGMTAALIALAGNSTATLLGRHVNRTGAHHPVAITTVSMSIGAVVLVLGAVISQRPMPRIGVTTGVIVAWMTLVNTAAAFSLWTWVLHRVTAAEASSINNLMLIEIGALGWIFLDEHLGIVDIVGIAVVLAGVTITQRRRRLPRPVKHSRLRPTADVD